MSWRLCSGRRSRRSRPRAILAERGAPRTRRSFAIRRRELIGLGVPQLFSFLLGYGVVQKRARPAFHTSYIFNFRGTALDGIEVDVEVKVRMVALGRALSQDHHQ